MTSYDAIVIGAGQAGPGVASALVGDGQARRDDRDGAGRRHLSEPRLQADQGAAGQRRRRPQRPPGGDYGVHTGEVSVDFGTAIRRVRSIIGEMQKSLDDWIASVDGLDYIWAPPGCRPTRRAAAPGEGRQPGADRAAGLPQRRRSGHPPADRWSRLGHGDDRGRAAGPRRAAGAPGHRGRRLHRLRVRPDVPPLRLRGDHYRQRRDRVARGPRRPADPHRHLSRRGRHGSSTAARPRSRRTPTASRSRSTTAAP